jgi:hypothetical protein
MLREVDTPSAVCVRGVCVALQAWVASRWLRELYSSFHDAGGVRDRVAGKIGHNQQEKTRRRDPHTEKENTNETYGK